MLDLLWKRHSQAGLQMLFHNTSPLGGQSQPRVFPQRSLSEAQAQGHLRSIMSAVLSESRASSHAKGFESTAPAWLAQAQPCASLSIRVNSCHPWLVSLQTRRACSLLKNHKKDSRSLMLMKTSCRNHCATQPRTNGSLHHSCGQRRDILLKSLQTRYPLFRITS